MRSIAGHPRRHPTNGGAPPARRIAESLATWPTRSPFAGACSTSTTERCCSSRSQRAFERLAERLRARAPLVAGLEHDPVVRAARRGRFSATPVGFEWRISIEETHRVAEPLDSLADAERGQHSRTRRTPTCLDRQTDGPRNPPLLEAAPGLSRDGSLGRHRAPASRDGASQREAPNHLTTPLRHPSRTRLPPPPKPLAPRPLGPFCTLRRALREPWSHPHGT